MLIDGAIRLKSAPDAVSSDRDLTREIDRDLTRLAHLEARARHEIGRAAARFVEIGGHHPLGFSRIGDYARERLGISGRELQSFAFVASRLEELPLVAGAFARGEISWSQTRLLCAVGDAESEGGWLVRARGMTVRDLVLEIRGASRVAVGDWGDALDEESDSTEGEPRMRYSVPCTGRVLVMWRRAIEFARRMIGSQAPVWQAAEAIVAEASSAMPIESDDEAVQEIGVVEVPRLARVEVEAEEPEPLANLEDMDAFELDAEMRELVGMLQSTNAEIGAALRRVVDLRIYRAIGFSSFDAYVHERLGISPAKARTLVMLERRSREFPELGKAYRSGALSWVRALAILPAVNDSPAWVTRAREVPVRRLQDEVEWALDMRDAYERPTTPPELDAELPRPDLQT